MVPWERLERRQIQNAHCNRRADSAVENYLDFHPNKLPIDTRKHEDAAMTMEAFRIRWPTIVHA